MSGYDPTWGSRELGSQETDHRGFEEVRVDDIDPLAPEKPREANQGQGIAEPIPGLRAEALHAEGAHLFVKGDRVSLQRAKEELIAGPIVASCQVDEVPACVAGLGEVEQTNHRRDEEQINCAEPTVEYRRGR
jgi:hypothetical protein